jgi:hypothetical protein
MSVKLFRAAVAGGSLCVGALLSPVALAQVLSSDDFSGIDLTSIDPDPGTPGAQFDTSTTAAPLSGATTGTGFGMPWFVQNSDRSTPGYNITATTPLVPGGGNYAIGGDAFQGTGRVFDGTDAGPFAANGLRNGDFDGGNQGSNNRLGTPGSSLLISANFRVDVGSGDQKYLQIGRDSNLRFGNNNDNAAIVIGDVDGSAAASRFYTLSSNGTDVTSTAPYTVGTSDLLIVRVDYAATGVGDPSATTFAVPATLSLFVNPADPLNPSGTPAATLLSTDATFSGLGFYGGNGAGQSSFDNFSVSVAPPVPEPVGLSALGLAAALTTLRRRRA